MDTDSDEREGIQLGIRQHLSSGNRELGQLDSKQSPWWFNCDEDDRATFSAASDPQRCLRGSSIFHLTEHLVSLSFTVMDAARLARISV